MRGKRAIHIITNDDPCDSRKAIVQYLGNYRGVRVDVCSNDLAGVDVRHPELAEGMQQNRRPEIQSTYPFVSHITEGNELARLNLHA